MPRSASSSTRVLRGRLEREGHAEQVRELPLDAPTVILRRPIAGGLALTGTGAAVAPPRSSRRRCPSWRASTGARAPASDRCDARAGFGRCRRSCMWCRSSPSAVGLGVVKPILIPIAVIAFVHAWAIPELYAARGAGVVRARSRAEGSAASGALGLLGDLVGHDARALHARTGLVLERGRARGVAARRGGRAARSSAGAPCALLLREGHRSRASGGRPDRPPAAGAARGRDRVRDGRQPRVLGRGLEDRATAASRPAGGAGGRRSSGTTASHERPLVGPSGRPRFTKFVPRANAVFRPPEHHLGHDTSSGNFQGDAPRGPPRGLRSGGFGPGAALPARAAAVRGPTRRS